MAGGEPDVTQCVVGWCSGRGREHHNGPVDPRNAAADVVAAVDRRAPGLIRFLAGLRWGGLRTVQPDRAGWAAVMATGTAVGLSGRWLVGRVAGRPRPSVPVAAALGQGAVWLGVWRWDTERWRRGHVSLVVELPPDGQLRLLEDLQERGLEVERWESSDRGGGRTSGLTCRSRDLRSVNAAIDAVLRGGADGRSPDRAAIGEAAGALGG
jgi:hypothetical protein